MIKVIFLDWGDVFSIVSDDRKEKFNEILRPFGFDWQKFYPIWRQIYLLRSAGKIKTDGDFENYIRRISQKEIPVQKLIEAIIESQIIPKEHIEAVKELQKKYKVGILSNNVQGWVERVMKKHQIENLFDAVIVSSNVGERKPHAIIYYEALKQSSVKPGEIVLVADEMAEDLVAASGVGMKTVWFNNPEMPVCDYDKKVSEIYKPDGIIKNLKELISVVDNL